MRSIRKIRFYAEFLEIAQRCDEKGAGGTEAFESALPSGKRKGIAPNRERRGVQHQEKREVRKGLSLRKFRAFSPGIPLLFRGLFVRAFKERLRARCT